MKKLLLLLLSILLILTSCLNAPVELETPRIPEHPEIERGAFSNGINWLYLPNSEPENRLSIRLIVRAGSILEEDDQLGLAHFVEHMAFNGTSNFSKQDIINYFENIGMEFGPEVNAYTSFDETVYKIEIPSDATEIIDTSFQILQDWAFGVLFEDSEIEDERGVIEEEWRLGRDAHQRVLDQSIPYLLKDTLYAERLPIGDIDVIKNAPAQRLRDFYYKWYRPELMTIVICGDGEKDVILDSLQTYFDIPHDSDVIKNVPESVIRPNYSYPQNPGNRELSVVDKELSYDELIIYKAYEAVPADSEEKRLQDLITSIAFSALQSKLKEPLYDSEPPYLWAQAGKSSIIKGSRLPYFYVAAKSGAIEPAFERAYTIFETVVQNGFSVSDVETAINEYETSLTQMLAEADQFDSAGLANQLVSHELNQHVFTELQWDMDFFAVHKAEITPAKCRVAIYDSFKSNESYFLLTGPEEGGSIAQLKELQADIKSIDLRGDIEEEVLPDSLMERPEKNGDVIDEYYITDDDIQKLTLSNGAHVYVKTTDFDSNTVLFKAVSPGGLSLESDADYISGTDTIAMLEDSGLADFTPLQLEKIMSSSTAKLSPYIDNYWEGFAGSSSTEDIEDLFKMLNLWFTSPRFNEESYNSFVNRQKDYFENQLNDPRTVYQNRLQTIVANGHPRLLPFTIDSIDSYDFEAFKRVYKNRFEQPGDFDYIFVGNVDANTIKHLAEIYIAGLGNQDESTFITETIIPYDHRPPADVIQDAVLKGQEPQSIVSQYYHGYGNYSHEEQLLLKATAGLIDIKLREKIREEMGGAYSIGAYGTMLHIPEGKFVTIIQFGCDPERVNELSLAVLDTIASIEITSEDINKLQQQYFRSWEEGVKNNGFWLNLIEDSIKKNDTYVDIKVDPDEYNAIITADNLYKAIQTYFSADQYVQLTLLPE